MYEQFSCGKIILVLIAAELESEIPVCKINFRFSISLARLNSGKLKLEGSDQERYNGKSQENQMVGLMDLDGQMCGMQVKKIAGYKIILRD